MKNEFNRPEISDISKIVDILEKLKDYPDMVEQVKLMYYDWKAAQTNMCVNCSYCHYYFNDYHQRMMDCDLTGACVAWNDFCSNFKQKDREEEKCVTKYYCIKRAGRYLKIIIPNEKYASTAVAPTMGTRYDVSEFKSVWGDTPTYFEKYTALNNIRVVLEQYRWGELKPVEIKLIPKD